jgi:hypothetical protein
MTVTIAGVGTMAALVGALLFAQFLIRLPRRCA